MTARMLFALVLFGGAAAAQERAVFRNGDVVEGAITLDAGRKVAQCGKESWPTVELCLVEEEGGSIVWAPSFAWRLQGYHLLVRHRSRKTLKDLLRRALQIRDAPLARDLFERACNAGLSGRATASLQGRVKYLEGKNSRAFSIDAVSQIRKDLGVLDAAEPRLLIGRAKVARKAHPDRALALLRAALRLAPKDPDANALLKQLAPADFPLGDARTWLEWRLDVESHGATQVPPDHPTVRRFRRLWRPDVYGVRSGPLLLVTPVRDMAVVGRCLACGRIATGLLSTLFPATAKKKAPKNPMVVLLYPDKASYEASQGEGSAEASFLKWTSGYYSPSERLSRFYWFADRDAERRIVGTCVHELTHQWLDEENPLCHGSELKHGPGLPGYWIVEGFATFLEEGVYDLDRGTWDLFDPRSSSLDTVQGLARKNALVAWGPLYGMNQVRFGDLSPIPAVEIVPHWYLGRAELSPKRSFYDQAAATCQYLYEAENGRYRRALFRYVVDYYAGRAERLGIQEAFGMTAEQLGERVVAFADAVENGKFHSK